MGINFSLTKSALASGPLSAADLQGSLSVDGCRSQKSNYGQPPQPFSSFSGIKELKATGSLELDIFVSGVI